MDSVNENKISLQQFLPLSEFNIRGFLHPAQANFGLRGFSLSSWPRYSLIVLLL
jgi:hypothetical protein